MEMLVLRSDKKVFLILIELVSEPTDEASTSSQPRTLTVSHLTKHNTSAGTLSDLTHNGAGLPEYDT